MLDIIQTDNEFCYFNEFQKQRYKEAVEIGYSNDKYLAVVNTENSTTEEIKDFLFIRKIKTKYGKLQRVSDTYRM